MPPRTTLAVTALVLTLLAQSRAVIVANGDGTQNTTAPANDFGFANVGQVFDTADGIFIGGVYLGNGWMISAYHGVRNGTGGFSFGQVILAGNLYTVESQSAVRLTTTPGNPADLAVFRLVGPEPNLPSVALSGVTPPSMASLAMAGNGRNRAATETHWNVNTLTEPDTWTVTPSPGDRQGYFYLPGATPRWGTNLRTADALLTADTGSGVTTLFRTSFSNDATALPDEAQGAPGDSGGGVFYHNGQNWELAGIMLAVGQLNGQPAETAVFGNQTFIADVATYRNEIVSIVPEPSTAMLAALGVVALASRRRRR